MTPAVTVHPNREAWLAARRRRVTSSDVPPLLGCYPSEASRDRKNPYALWLQKVEEAPDADLGMELRFDLGRIVEPRIAEEVERRADVGLIDLGDFATVEESDGILMSTPDRLIAAGPASELPPWFDSPADCLRCARGVAEFKTDAVQDASTWGESAKFDYALLQLHVGLICCGKQEGLIATCFGMGLAFEVYPVVRSADLEALIRERVEEFWSYVEAGTPPSSAYIDSSEAVGRSLAEIYRRDSGEEINLDPEHLELVERYQALGEEIKAAKEEQQEIKNRVLADLGPATFGRIPGYMKRWKWAVEPRKGYTVEPTESRVLRLVKA